MKVSVSEFDTRPIIRRHVKSGLSSAARLSFWDVTLVPVLRAHSVTNLKRTSLHGSRPLS